MPDTYVDFQGTSGVSCTESTHDYPHEHTIEVDGGRDRELVFKAYIPGNQDFYNSAEDSIVIKFDKSFDLPDSLTLTEPGTNQAENLITISRSGSTATVDITDQDSAIPNDTIKELTLVGATNFTGADALADGDFITITIKAGTGIETPETPQGFDNFEDEEPYEVTIAFVDGGDPSIGREEASDKNFVIVKNPISSTVPSATVRVELATHAETDISTTDDIVVDFSGPSPNSGFILPSTMATSRIQVHYLENGSSKTFNPSEVQVQGERVIFAVPTGKDDARIAFRGDYTITFSNLARIKNPFSAGIKTIKVSSFVIGDEEDIVETVVRRTTTVNPQEGARGSEFTLEGKGYATGTVTVYHDADDDKNIDPGETLASVKAVRGAFRTKLTAGGNPGEAQYRVRTRDSEGVEVSKGFNIRSSMSFEPETVGLGSNLTIIISDWEEERNEVVAVQIAGKTVFIADAIQYGSCIEHPNAARRDSEGKVTLTVEVQSDTPLGQQSDIPPGEQTVAVFDHGQLDYFNDAGDLITEIACHELAGEMTRGQFIGPLERGFRTDDPIAITKATVEIVANQLEFSRSSAARGQRITITGSGFDRGTNGDNGIRSVLINGIDVDEDTARFEVTSSGDFAFTVTVPIGVVDGDNEVRVEGTESNLAQGTLNVPAASIELEPPESRRGARVRVAGSHFIASRPVSLSYGDGGDLSVGDESIGSAFADSTGGFAFTFNVPITAEIGRTHVVTAVSEATEDGATTTVRAEADHGPPKATITTSPEQVSPGDTLTVKGRNMPPFAQVRPIEINGIDVTPGPNPGTDRNGAFEAKVIIPQLELGDQLLRVEVSEVVITHVIDVVHHSIGRPPTEIFGVLIDAEALGRIWLYRNIDQSWSLYDPDPVFDEFNTLSKLDAGDIVWMNLTKSMNFQGEALREGWNLVRLE